MRKITALLLVTLFIGASLGACNTIRGAGQDIERGGEAVQDAAE